MRVKAQEALYNFLSVVRPKCGDVGLLLVLDRNPGKKKKILYHQKPSNRFTLIGMAGQPILCENPNHPWKTLNVICDGQIFQERKHNLKTMNVSFEVQPSD